MYPQKPSRLNKIYGQGKNYYFQTIQITLTGTVIPLSDLCQMDQMKY